jgi:protein-L-isoaspartate(D-aspartate) O-methyltransferase
MYGLIIPPPREPTKSSEEFTQERAAKVQELLLAGYLQSECIQEALLKIPREIFIPRMFQDYAYLEVPLPLPGKRATISCPHSYPLFYESLGLDRGHKFLEIGTGSGYGAAVAREVVGAEGLVVSIEIDPTTFEFARRNLEQTGFNDIILVNSDGGCGYPEKKSFDRIAITAACATVPPELIKQLSPTGRLITPLQGEQTQKLVLFEREPGGLRSKIICEVLYVPLRGVHGS